MSPNDVTTLIDPPKAQLPVSALQYPAQPQVIPSSMRSGGNGTTPSSMRSGGSGNSVSWGMRFATNIVNAVLDTEAAKKLRRDIWNFDISNQNEEVVLNSAFFSAYKGSLVIRHSLSEIPFLKSVTSCAIGGIIWLNRNETDTNTVRHEKGHTVQEKMIGPRRYIEKIAIPSLTHRDAWDTYFSNPWERGADYFGDVTDRKQTDGSSYTYTCSPLDAYVYMHSSKVGE